MINFNQAASAFPKAPGVAEAVRDFLAEGAFNVQRGGGLESLAVGDVVFETRERLASFFSAPHARQVVFTSGVTAALNTLIFAWLNPGDHVIASTLDHNAILRPLEAATKVGVSYSLVQASSAGTVKAEQFEELFTEKTRAVITTSASNVSGALVPIKEIASLCQKKGVKLIVDSAQTAGVLPLGLADGIDAICFTGHKGLLGPQGIGGMVLAKSIGDEIRPFIYGGTGSRSDSLSMATRLPDKLEAGTLNLPGIVGLNVALSYIQEIGLETIAAKKRQVLESFLSGLRGLEKITVLGPGSDDQVSVVSIDVVGEDNALIAAALSDRGVLTRSGLHCAPLAHRSLGTFPAGSVRFSFGFFNTLAEVDQALDALAAII